jgi:glutamate dehydrogenase
MLQSDRTALVAAFDHRHIFVDPTPNPARAFAERRRLFDQPGSSWADYDASAISAGGGVWPRDAKLIELSPEAKQALGIDSDGLTPADLIRGILSAPVDLLWNGGVGTFVKASTETNELVGDRGNDALRIDATELRARVVGEGGNLGLTQRARIEYAMAGGAVNTDFIDNSGGVDCSDREVNLKILLGLAEERGELDRTERDTLIEAVSDDVVARILYDSFLQAQILGQEIEESAKRLETYEDLMVQLEAEDLLLRELEGLPGPEEMTERARTGTGLTGPELAVLLAYAKRSLRTAILASDLPDRPHFDGDLSAYFPDAVSEAFGYQITHHPLRRELVATIVSNEVVNSEGITFVSRLMAETGAEPDAVVRAYRIARRVTRATRRWEDVEALVDLVDPEVQNELMHEVDELVESTARWYLANPTPGSIDETADAAAERFDELVRHLAALTPEQWREDKSVRLAELRRAGVPHDVAHRHIFETELLHGSEIIDVAGRSQRSVGDVADAFYYVGAPAGLDWLGERVALLPAGTRWHRRAAEAVEDDLRRLRRTLAERVLAECPELPPQPAVEQYLERRRRRVDRLDRFLRVLAADGVDDVASAVVAMRQVESLLA